MVGTIVPVGNGQGDEGERKVFLTYTLGSLTGALLMGSFWGFLGVSLQKLLRLWFARGFLANTLSAFTGILFLVAAAIETGLLDFPVPQSGWQVPRSWFYTLGRQRGAFLYGSVLGSGFLTPLGGASLPAIALWIMLTPAPRLALVLFAFFSLGRVMPLFAIWLVIHQHGMDKVTQLSAIAPLRAAVLVVNGMILATIGPFLLIRAVYR
jgi:hypothetical protein